MQKKICKFCILVLTLFNIFGCSINNSKNEDVSKLNYINKETFLLDTIVDIKIYDKKDPEIIDEAIEYIKNFEKKFSSYDNESEIYKLNHNNSEPLKVSHDVIDCINKSLYYSELTNGTFDISIGSVSLLWDFSSHDKNIPNDYLIKENLKFINYKDIIINDETVLLKNKKMALDLGAIAKGYIADKLKEFLISKGVKSAIINLGGNVLTIGQKNNEDFKIGIQDPNKERNQIIATVNVNNKSVVTSGIYERYINVDGKKYHHILDPKTGYPVDNDILQTTIISDSSTDGDALSTSTFLLGKEKGMHLINSLDNIEACFYLKDGSIIKSKNFDTYLSK